jgi:hypothetical protein
MLAVLRRDYPPVPRLFQVVRGWLGNVCRSRMLEVDRWLRQFHRIRFSFPAMTFRTKTNAAEKFRRPAEPSLPAIDSPVLIGLDQIAAWLGIKPRPMPRPPVI